MNKQMIIKFWRNGPLWNALGSLMYGANSFLLLMLASRSSGVEATGLFGIAFTTAQLLFFFGIFGASNYQMTDYKGRFAFRTYAVLKFFSCILMLAGSVIACILLEFEKEKTVMTLVLTAYMLAHVIAELFQSHMFQQNRLDMSGRCLFFRTLFSLLSFYVCLKLSGDLLLSVFVLALANIAAIVLFSYLPCRTLLRDTRSTTMAELASLMRACLPLMFAQLLTNLLLQMPKYAVEQYQSDEILGIFNMIFMPVQVINLVSSFIYRPMVKPLSDYVQQGNRRGLIRLIGRQTVLVGILGGACIVGSWFLGTPVLGILYGTDLSAYRVPLLLIVLGSGAFAFSQCLYYIVLIFRRQMLIFWNYGFCTAVFALLCPMLVRGYGIYGAVIGFISIHGILLCGYLWILASLLRRMKYA